MARSFQIDCSDVSDLCRSESGSSTGSSGLFYHTPKVGVQVVRVRRLNLLLAGSSGGTCAAPH